MATRRDFLKNITLVSGVLATTPLLAGSEAAKPKKMKTGIQLWSVRDVIDKDLTGTLTALSKIGYNSLEPYGFDGSFYKTPAKEFRKMCEDLGMVITSTHCGITVENALLYTEKAAEAGLEYLILPSFGGRPEKTLDDFKKVAHEINQIGEITKKSGIKFGYHNHNVEFKTIEGKLPYDILLAETDPALVTFEMDIFWVVKGGQDPLQYFEKHHGRFQLWHVKDMGNDGESCIVGNGHIRFQDLMKHSKKAGLKRIVYEQEQYSEGTPLFCAEQSYKYIQKYLI
jgi:sugar phosphate isomerase/epimerase